MKALTTADNIQAKAMKTLNLRALLAREGDGFVEAYVTRFEAAYA